MIPLRILNEFLTAILNDRRYVDISPRPFLVEIIESVPDHSNFWYLEKTSSAIYLWERKVWDTEQDRKSKIREQNRAYMAAVDARKDAYNSIRKALVEMLGFSSEDMNTKEIKILAGRILKSRNIDAAKLVFHIDLSDIPELPTKHTVYDMKGNVDYEL